MSRTKSFKVSRNLPQSNPVSPLEVAIDPTHPGIDAQRAAALARAHQSPRCSYIKPNGVPCGSAAMRDHDLCYYHDRYRAQPDHETLPLLDDAASIQCAIHEVLCGILSGNLDRKDAAHLLYGLQIASSNLKHLQAAPRQEQTAEKPKSEHASRPPYAGRFQPTPTHVFEMRNAIRNWESMGDMFEKYYGHPLDQPNSSMTGQTTHSTSDLSPTSIQPPAPAKK